MSLQILSRPSLILMSPQHCCSLVRAVEIVCETLLKMIKSLLGLVGMVKEQNFLRPLKKLSRLATTEGLEAFVGFIPRTEINV